MELRFNNFRRIAVACCCALGATCVGGCGGPMAAPSPSVHFDVQGVGLSGTPLIAEVERTSDEFQDATGAIDVYVPDGVTEPTPVLILLQGARVHKSYYSRFCARIAAHGFIVAAANHDSPLGFFTSTQSVQDVLDALATKSSDIDDPLFGIIDFERVGLVGHSFGGATALTLVQGDCTFPFCSTPFDRPDSLRAVAVYASHLVTLNDYVIAVDARGLPVQMLLGDRDAVAASDDIVRTFDALQNGAKHLVELKGANHFAINDLNNPPGTITDSNEPIIEQDVSIAIAANWVGLFMSAHVADDAAALAYLMESGTQENDVYDASHVSFQLQPTPVARATMRTR